jgi:endonuclease VIII
MPEGDSYTRAASLLRPGFLGRTLVAVDGVPAVRRASPRLVGRRIEDIRTHGKHLLVDIEGDLTIHVWMGMPGRWWVRNGADRARVEGEFDGGFDRGAIRLELRSDRAVARCYAAPTVEVDRRKVIDHNLRRLGPDVLDEDFDVESYLERAALLPGDTTVADLLLDQRVLAGVGNEYKNEVLFLEGLHPATRIVAPNAERGGARVTTGMPWNGGWVYDRAGQPCRRCRTPVAVSHLGVRNPRITYWCPTCQPAPTPPPADPT